MGKLIDQQVAIDAVKGLSLGETDATRLAMRIEDYLKRLPSAEHKIIHCRECKYAHLTYGGDCKYCDKWLDDDGFNLTLYLDGGFYCGYAERKNND